MPAEISGIDLSVSWERLAPMQQEHGRWKVIYMVSKVAQAEGFPLIVTKREASSRAGRVRATDFRLNDCGMAFNQEECDQLLVRLLNDVALATLDDITFRDCQRLPWNKFPQIVPEITPRSALLADVERIMRPDIDRARLMQGLQSINGADFPEPAMQANKRRL